jgi:hypothetical protein
MVEVWLDIIGYEGLYMISDQGRVKSVGYGKERILKPVKQTGGYFHVNLYKDGIRKQYLIHRLVCLNFLDNPFNKPDVNHLNGIKDDNRLINLEWSTRSENNKHAFDNGLKISSKGINHGSCKLTEKEVLEIRQSDLKLKELGKIYGVSFQSISYIKRRKIWNHI